jgi:amino acid transporter
MGFRDLLLFYVVTGVSLRWIATAAAAGPSSIVIWVGAWLAFYTPLALSVIELSSRYPNEGGIYVWSKHAFGDFFRIHYCLDVLDLQSPLPAVLYLPQTMHYIRHDSTARQQHHFLYRLFTGGASDRDTANLFGLDVGTWLHNLGALAMWIPVVIIIAMGAVAWHRYGSATSFVSLHDTEHSSQRLHFLVGVLTYAFAGSETASLMGDEIKNARRAVPWALFIGGVTVTICYIAGTIGVMLALPASEVGNLQGLMQAISSTAHRVGFEGVIPIAALLIMLSNVGAAGAYLAAVARLPFVAGIDRFLPPAFGALHPRWKTPWMGLLTQFVFGAIFIFLGQAGTSIKGAYDVLVSMGVITYFIPYLYLFAAMFKLQSEPVGPDVIRVPGGKPVAYTVSIVGFATTVLTIAVSVLPPPDEPNKPLAVFKIVGGCGALVLIGVWLYLAGKRRAGRGQQVV